MSDVDRRFHETWLGMVQPIEGLVVSIPVLVDAQCMERQPPSMQEKLVEICPPTRQGEAGPEGYRVADLARLFQDVLGFSPDAFDADGALSEELSLYVPEGKQTLRPTLALRRLGDACADEKADATPASRAGARYEILVWDLGNEEGAVGLDLDKPETVTGPWDYPPAAKFDRLLRHCRVPVGLLTNRDVVRLVYAPHGESSGAITFRLDDMASVGGRPILDAFVMLLSANRFFGVTDVRTLPAILAESRKRQANVTNDLAEQVFDALQILLRGFEAAAERDGHALLQDALERENDHLYKGLLTVLLRLVFVLYAEDRGLLPVDREVYAKSLSVLALFDELQADHGAYPDAMSRRFGAWGRIVTLFRAIYLGLSHGELTMPPRRGSLFNPHEYAFLEGWGPAGSAPITQPEDRAAVQLPSVDDETVFRVLEKLLVFEGQRLSYRALDVEQIGSVYEALMGYHVVRTEAPAVCMRPDRIWLTVDEVREVPAARRAKWIKETVGLSASQADKLAQELAEAKDDAALEALAKYAAGKKTEQALSCAKAGQLVLQPGSERRRTSSHYTPRSLSAPIVRRTLEPLLAVMGDAPASERILRLKVCDPAMGSGAFLVEACRFLADHVLAAWTREGKVEAIANEHGDPLLHARRLVAQRCLYGVDKNPAAVELAKLSLWLVTLSKTLPFTFLDHSLRHGDSLVGLDFDQIRSFHWKPGKQVELFTKELDAALEEAIALREKISELAFSDSAQDHREKERLLWDAEDALDRVRLVGDLVVGAFFSKEKDGDRQKERNRRLDLASAWLRAGGPPSDELRTMQEHVRARVPVFHWMLEFPEVFYAARQDPLDTGARSQSAHLDACLGNPPFMGGGSVSGVFGNAYLAWLLATHEGTHGNGDLCAHFFRRGISLLGTNGCLGFIATNTIAQGDTRAGGLRHITRAGARIYDARPSLLWPGSASVAVATVNVAIGVATTSAGAARLDGRPVASISSRLLAENERDDARPLKQNAELYSLGSKITGQGFLVTPDEYGALVETDARNAQRLFPYLGGDEVNSHPEQMFHRYVIDFGKLSLEEARRWPDLLRIVEERVKPERDRGRDDQPSAVAAKQRWWQHWAPRIELYAALTSFHRCLVTAQVTKHLCFSFQPTGRVYSQKLYVFTFDRATQFAVLQSRPHVMWTWRLSSTMKNDLNYSASDCFETFPFPMSDPRAILPRVEDFGERLYASRAQYMVDENVGLTITYNRLNDPSCTDSRILNLRALHEEMDRVVLAAYAENDPEGRWSAIDVPPYCPLNVSDKAKLAAFEDAVIDRLFALNAKRAEEEKRVGLGAKEKSNKKKGSSPSTAKPSSPRKSKKTTDDAMAQLDLAPDPTES